MKAGSRNIDLPLHSAVIHNQLRTVESLCSRGAATESRDSLGRTPLHLTALHNRLPAAKILHRHGANINALDNKGNTPFHYAASKGFSDMVRYLRQQGANMMLLNNDHHSGLSLAAAGGAKGVVRQLHRYGVEIDGDHCGEGIRPLHAAIAANQLSVVKYLCRIKADVNRTALQTAIAEGYPEMVQVLLAAGAKIDDKSGRG